MNTLQSPGGSGELGLGEVSERGVEFGGLEGKVRGKREGKGKGGKGGWRGGGEKGVISAFGGK